MGELRNSFINEGEKKQEKPKKGIKTYLQNKYVAAALLVALLGGSYATYQSLKDKSEHKKEIVIKTDPHPFEKHTLDFRDNDTTFFTKNLQLQKETLAPGVHIIRDAGLTFYVVQKEDIKETKETTYTYKKKGKKKIKEPHTTIHKSADFDKIRDKLSAIPEFSYLKESEYDRNNPNNKTKSFNVPKGSVTAGMYIPIPLDNNVREISPQDFANYCYDAIEEMRQDSSGKYFDDIQKILAGHTDKELIISMLSFARSETTGEYTKFIQPIGDVELHRREDGSDKTPLNAFSFTYFHILMEKNSDGVTAGPGLKARIKLGLTEGQCYHPKNACKLFLAYRIEKIDQINQGRIEKNKKNKEEGKSLLPMLNIADYLPLTKDNLTKTGTMYNGSSDYAKKLGPNLEFATKLMNGEITFYDNTNLKKVGFTYTGFDSKFEHTYKFATPKGITSNDELKKKVIEEFNKNKAADCPAIDETDIVTQSNKSISGTIIPDTILVKVPKKS